MTFNNEPTDEEFFNAVSSTRQGANDSFQVYNPVDDSFEEWPSGQIENGPQTDSFHDDNRGGGELPHSHNNGYNNNRGGGEMPHSHNNGFNNNRGGGELPHSHNNGYIKSDKTSSEDDALARSIAEQDLPPGVTAVEQQEIMMRLLTQQLRRGEDFEEGVSPLLEQRLRE